jgi:hypothetical protein
MRGVIASAPEDTLGMTDPSCKHIGPVMDRMQRYTLPAHLPDSHIVV